MDNVGKIDLKEQLKSLFNTGINLNVCQVGAIQWAINQVDISKTETTSEPCWHCDGIEDHKIVLVTAVVDEFGRELPAYDTPYNYCPACGRKLN